MPPKPKYIAVKNINHTSNERYTISELSDKYLQAGGTPSSKCQVENCTNIATATGHVIKTHGNASNTWYLTKLCASHNNHNNVEPMKISAPSLVKLSKVTKKIIKNNQKC